MYRGFGRRHFDHYEQLAADNSRAFWTEHEDFYKEEIKGRFDELAAELRDELGTGKVFRPWRDARFARGGGPLKEEQSVFWGDDSRGVYLELSRQGVRTGFGYRPESPAALAQYRRAVDDAGTGAALADEVGRLRARGWAVVGGAVKTAPRGYAPDHPRIDLLRYRDLGIEQLLAPDEHLALDDPAAHLRGQLTDLGAVREWFEAHARV